MARVRVQPKSANPKRSLTNANDAAIAEALSDIIEPPAHVKIPKGAMPFWNSIVSARPRDTWTSADLEMAANLARTKYDIEEQQAQLYKEGNVILNERGTQHMNPRHTVLEMLSRRCVLLSRTIYVHSAATTGMVPEDMVPKAKRAKAAAEAAAPAAEVGESLIPTLRSINGGRK